jgi:hypothetical protein
MIVDQAVEAVPEWLRWRRTYIQPRLIMQLCPVDCNQARLQGRELGKL